MRTLFFFLFLLTLSCSALAASDVVSWREVTAESGMTFVQGAGAVVVPVTSFRSDVTFEPEQFAGGRIVLYADLTGVFMPPETFADPNMQQNLALTNSMGGGKGTPGPGTAVITSTTFRKQGEGSFVMEATMGLNGRTKAVEIPFTAAVVNYFDVPKLVIEGSFSFMPKDFAAAKLSAPQGVETVKVDFKFAGIPEQAQ